MIQNDTAFSGERPSRLLLAFKGGFVAVFLVLVGCILADYDQNFAFSRPAALAALLLIAVFLFLCFKIIQHDRFVARHFGIIVAFAAIFLFTAQLFFASRLRFDPIFDLEAVFRGAQDWAQTGSFTDYASSTCYGNYFYMFPNNLGALALLTALFRVALLLRFTDFFAVATLFCALLFCAAMVLSALCARRLFGAAGGVISLLFFLCCPPFYLIAPVFYTDALSLPFPILAFFLFLRSEAATTRCRRLLYQLAMALALAFGALLKPTVLLCAIAIALFLLCRKQWKKALAWGLLSALVAALVFSAFFAFIYRTQLNQTTAQQLKIPTSYWLATAVSGKGQFCSDCFVLALRTPDPTLRDTALKAVIAEQLHARDLHSLLQLVRDKSVFAFGDGTFGLSDFLDDRPLHSGFLQTLVLYGGANYPHYATFCSVLFLGCLLLMICSACLYPANCAVVIPQLCVFGIWLFLLFWEVNSRYITNMLPLVLLCSVGGLVRLFSIFSATQSKFRRRECLAQTH